MGSPVSAASNPTPAPGNQGVPASRAQIPKLEPRRRRVPPSNPVPSPETPALPWPPELSTLSFKTPSRRILSPKDHGLFLASPTYSLLLAFVFGLSESVQDQPLSAARGAADLSSPVKTIVDILGCVEKLLEQSPPTEQGGSRFGNKTFRDFLDLIQAAASGWHEGLGLEDAVARDEVATYLTQSFGNKTRIDYGSGHELNFVTWLLCLYQLRVLAPADFRSLVLVVFSRYLDLMRKVQMTYYLEPAGSHGVWGLDDYQFLPFLFGASQLLHHPHITPLAIHQDLALEEFGHDYLYLGQVSFVNSTKTVRGLRWHSPMLDDISSAKSWAKIEGGMRRMFVAEVLRKLPVMQHFLFGSLVPAVEGMSTEGDLALGREEDEAEGGELHLDSKQHKHKHVGWGDCCGIKVPSSIGAAQEMKKRGAGEALRRIPFD